MLLWLVKSSVLSATASSSPHTNNPSDKQVGLGIATSKIETPVQPVIKFPHTMYGKTGRSFQARWYKEYPWLEYSRELDAAFCFACRFFHPKPLRADKAFIETGFRDWKHALGHKGILTAHSTGKAHSEAMMSWREFDVRAKSGNSVAMQLDNMGTGTAVISQNRAYVMQGFDGGCAVLCTTRDSFPRSQ